MNAARTLFCPWLLEPAGWRESRLLRLDGHGMIQSIESGRPAQAEVALPGPVVPGMTNAHSHAHQRLIAGLTARRGSGEDSFWSWREQMYRAVGLLDPAGLRAVAAWLYAELLEGGYTSIGEFHYLHHAPAAENDAMWRALTGAADDSGVALTLLPVWYRYSGFGRLPAEAAQAPFVHVSMDDYLALVRAVRDATRHDPTRRLGLAPHSLRAVDVDDLPALLEAVPDVPVHIHIAEQRAEVEQCLAHTGLTPVRLLHQRVGLDRRWCLVHATHADEETLELMAAQGVVAGLCPTTEADLGDGLFAAAEFLALGGRMAIGSDSNLRTGVAEELRLLDWSQRYRTGRRNVLTGERERGVGEWLWRHAAAAGADALDQPAGELVAGRRADLVVLDENHALLAGLPPAWWLDALVFGEQSGMIDQVWVAGRCRVRAGRHVARDALRAGWTRARAALAGAL